MSESQHLAICGILYFILAAQYRNDSLKIFTLWQFLGISCLLTSAGVTLFGAFFK